MVGRSRFPEEFLTMSATTVPLLAMTAEDLMTTDVVSIPEEMPLREAARCLVSQGISGAPVVDSHGVCIGVVSSVDFLRYLAHRDPQQVPAAMARPLSCSYQHRSARAGKQFECTLAPGACSVQVQQKTAQGENLTVCNQPHCVFADWQVVEMEELPCDDVRNYMTPDPVTATADESVQRLARRMIDAHVHRVIIVDESKRPIGIVASTDILAAVCYAELEGEASPNLSPA